MAGHIRTASEIQFSRTLFMEEDGRPISFYCEFLSDNLQTIFEKGGAYLVKEPAEADILLCEKRTDNKISDGYLPLDFIVDCVKKNSFLNVDKYRADNLGLKASTSRSEISSDTSDEENMVKISGTSRISVKSAGLLGRKKYTDAEDINIIKYLINHNRWSEAGGNTVWKQMALVKITEHSFQSMKARFHKKIVPDIDTYNISDEWKAKLRGNCTTDNPNKVSGQKGDIDSFNDFDDWKNKDKRLGEANTRIPANKIKSDQCRSPLTQKGLTSRDQPSTSESGQKNCSLRDQHSPAKINSIAAEALSDSLVSKYFTEELCESIESTNVQNKQLENCETANGDLDVIGGSEAHPVFPPDTVTQTQNLDYVYDDIDRLILSEANKNKSLDTADERNNLSQKSDPVILTRKRVNNMNIFEKCSPTKISKNVGSHYFEGGRETPKKVMKADNYADSPTQNNSMSIQTRNMAENMSTASNQQDNSGTVSKRYNRSINKIINVIKKGSSDSGTRNISKDHHSDVPEIESDTSQEHTFNKTNKVRKNRLGSNSLETELSNAQTTNGRQDHNKVFKPDNPKRPCRNSNSVSNSKSRSSNSRLPSSSAGQEEDGSTQATSRVLVRRKASQSSKAHNMTVESSNNASSNSESGSAHSRKHIKKKSTKKLIKGSTVDKVEPSSSTERHEQPSVEDVSLNWCTKEQTLRRVKFLSEEYGLDMNEAATLLMKHDGSFLSVIKYFES